MALEKCRECDQQVAERAIMCPSCGAANPGVAGGYSATTKIPSTLTIAGGVFLGVAAAGLVAWMLYGVVVANGAF